VQEDCDDESNVSGAGTGRAGVHTIGLEGVDGEGNGEDDLLSTVLQERTAGKKFELGYRDGSGKRGSDGREGSERWFPVFQVSRTVDRRRIVAMACQQRRDAFIIEQTNKAAKDYFYRTEGYVCKEARSLFDMSPGKGHLFGIRVSATFALQKINASLSPLVTRVLSVLRVLFECFVIPQIYQTNFFCSLKLPSMLPR